MRLGAWLGMGGVLAFVACTERAEPTDDETSADDVSKSRGDTGGTPGTNEPAPTGPFSMPIHRPTCGSTTKTIEEHCATYCEELHDDWRCYPSDLPTTLVYTGCGYVHFAVSGDVGDTWDEIYDATSRKLVYYSYVYDPFDGADCYYSSTAGTMPRCDDWALDCRGAGTAGFGGSL